MRRIVTFAARHPLAAPLLAGLVLRVVAAISGFGVFAADDYLYVIEPAWRWLIDPEYAFPSGFRSMLFPKIFSGSPIGSRPITDVPSARRRNRSCRRASKAPVRRGAYTVCWFCGYPLMRRRYENN